MTGVISAAFSRTGAVFVLLFVLCGFGYMSYLEIPKEATPDVDIPVAYVSVGYEGISPEDAMVIANYGGGAICERVGIQPITPQDLKDAICRNEKN